MGFENNEEWSIRSPAWAMGYIENVYKKLLEQKQGDTDLSSTAEVTEREIGNFTKWPSKRIQYSLAALRSAGKILQASSGAIEEQPAIDEKIFTDLPTIEHTAKLRHAVKKTWRDGMGKYTPPKSTEEEIEDFTKWGQRAPIWTMEVVKTTFNRLKEQGNFIYTDIDEHFDAAKIISNFLAWPEGRVREAYANLRAAGEIEPISSKKSRESLLSP